MIKILSLEKVKSSSDNTIWCVDTTYGFIGGIVRPDNETYNHLMNLMERCEDLLDIMHLDLSKEFYVNEL